MMQERITQEAAGYKSDAQRLFEDAVTALIALAFRFPQLGANFLWDADPVLEREANAILRNLSDSAKEAAKKRAREVIEAEGWIWSEEDWESIDDAWDEPMLTRFDLAGSHLRELLEVWIAIAFVEKMTQSYLKILVLRYIGNPYASPLWSRLPAGLLKWGRGYQKDLINQIALIGQGAIFGASRHAEWVDAASRGASYYIRRRGSNYDCPLCDSECGIPIPIEVPFTQSHPRCLCWPEFHLENGKELE